MRTFFSIMLLALCNYTFAQTYKDALIYDLRGHVKSCTYYEKIEFYSDDFEKGNTIEFNINGQLNKSNQYKRDSKNRIKESFDIVEHIYGNKFNLFVSYEYGENGYLKSETSRMVWSDGREGASSRIEYYYDSKGYVLKAISKDLAECPRIDFVTEYKYISFDKHGNWVEREYMDPLTAATVSVKRIIEYY